MTQRRHFISAAGLGFAGTFASTSLAAKPTDHMSVMLDCAKACDDCARECDSCHTHCADLLGKGKADHLATMKSCVDCASVCRAAGALAARGSSYANMICKTCAEVCDQCAAACEKHPDDEHMKRCAKTCRSCAEQCRTMAH